MTTQKSTLSEFADPAMGGAEQGVPATPATDVVGVHGGIDREGAMAKADLYKLASYSHKLYEKIEENTQLEAWVQAKITKAADYIASVYHYLEYEMKFSEYGHHLDNSDTLSEGQKMKIKEVLAEARSKMRDLKVAQSEKVAALEGVLNGGEETCSACGGTGVVHTPGAAIPDHVKSKVEKYNRQTKAFHAASKRLDKNNNGIPDSEEKMDEAAEKTPSTWTDSKGNKHPATKVKGDKYTGKEAEKESKSKDKDLDEATKTPTTWTDKSGKKHPATSVKGDKYTGKEAEKESKSKELDEASEKTASTWTDSKGNKHPATKVKGDKYTGKEAEKETKSKEKDLDESKPSAGLSAAKKSAVVKKAKAGGDIGKPGKGFDKLAKSAGGGEKGKKIAAAAMWKNIKETTAYIAEKAKAVKDLPGNQEKIDVNKNGKIDGDDLAKLRSGKKETVKESVETSRMREQLGRLNRNESHQLVESSEADQIRALTKRLLG